MVSTEAAQNLYIYLVKKALKKVAFIAANTYNVPMLDGSIR